MSECPAIRLAELTIEALERTAFVLAELADDGSDAGLPPAEQFAQIVYNGPSSGRVYLAASSGFARELAASWLGVEAEAIEPSQCTDALRELANIVGGSVTQELGGSECELSLGLPETVEESALPPVSDGVERCCLDSEGERLEVTWAPAEACANAAS